MIWCVLNEKGIAVSWPNTETLEGAKRIAKLSLGLDRIPKKWKVLPVDMKALLEAQTREALKQQEAETTTEVSAPPET
jgi:hypothetical protein